MVKRRLGLAIAGLAGLCAVQLASVPAGAPVSRPPSPRPALSQSTPFVAVQSAPATQAITALFLAAGGKLDAVSSAAGPQIVDTDFNWDILEFVSYRYEAAQQQKLFDAQIAACAPGRHGMPCNPAIKAWLDFIAAVKPLGDQRLKAELVNGFVNVMVGYDDAKASALASSDENFFLGNKTDQTPLETLLRRRGICGDMALLKIETLKRVGLAPQQIALVPGTDSDYGADGRQIDSGGHFVAMVTVGGKRYILNNQQEDLTAADFSRLKDARLMPVQREIFAGTATLSQPGRGGGRALAPALAPLTLALGEASPGEWEYFTPDGVLNATGSCRPWTKQDYAAQPAAKGRYDYRGGLRDILALTAGPQADLGIAKGIAAAFAQNPDNPYRPGPYRPGAPALPRSRAASREIYRGGIYPVMVPRA